MIAEAGRAAERVPTSIVSDMPTVDVPMADIKDWDTFHHTFARTLGFPDFYGRNMNAWVD